MLLLGSFFDPFVDIFKCLSAWEMAPVSIYTNFCFLDITIITITVGNMRITVAYLDNLNINTLLEVVSIGNKY